MNPDAYIEMANAEDTFWWFVGRRKIINASLSKLKFKKKPDILEIGSGTGGNLAMLSQFDHAYPTTTEKLAPLSSNILREQLNRSYDEWLDRHPTDAPTHQRHKPNQISDF